MSLLDTVDRFARPEYTGRDRCLPCTAVNLGIVGIAGAVLWRKHRLLGLFATLVGLVVVALRGYVVPGTPRFAPRLVAPLPFDFGHADDRRDSLSDPQDSPDTLAAEADPETVLEELVAAGVIDSDGTELFLEESFREEWLDRMESLRNADDEAFLERAVAASPSATGGEGFRHGDRVILAGDPDVRTSRAVAIAETAAIETLGERAFPEQYRAPAAPPLRTFLRTCPSCGGPVSETTIRNCCGGPGGLYADPEQDVLACETCDAVVVEL